VAVVIALHNAEEAAMAGQYLPLVREYIQRVPALRNAGVVPPSLERLYLALFIATLVPALAIGWATTGRDSLVKRELVIIVAAALLWNVFIPHLSAMIVLRGYAPGGLTAVAINLPFCVYLFRRTSSERVLTRGQMTLAAMMGLVLLAVVPLLLLL
jgi:hypothetical protein